MTSETRTTADDITRTSTVERLAAARAERKTSGEIEADLRVIAGYTDADIDALTEADLQEIADAVEVAAERMRAEAAGESWIEVVTDGPRTAAVGPYVEYGPDDDGLEVEAIIRGWRSDDGRQGWTADYSSQITVGSGESRRYRAPLVPPDDTAASRSSAAATLGRAGRGAAKVRGDGDHYRALVSARPSIEVTNDFHNTRVTLRPAADGWLSITQVRRARRILCPVTGCTCGASLGERGRQAWEYLDARNDGTVRVAARESIHE